jgi:predicted phosphate transport protein (TIGR00153 family)
MAMIGKKTATLIGEVSQYLDLITESGLVYNLLISDYLEKNNESFSQRIKKIDEMESEADNLRRNIRYRLYSKMLIPESRGDVLSIIENIDNLIDGCKEIAYQLDIEKPDFPEILLQDIRGLVAMVEKAIDHCVKAAREFFYDSPQLEDHVNKTYFYEHEADIVEDRLRRMIFSSKHVKDLALKIYLRDFISTMASPSDQAEAVCERISVAAIKRSF